MQHTAGTYYTPSGRAPFGGLIAMLLGGTVVAFLLSWVYGYLTWYNPFIYVNFLAAGGYGLLVGVATSFCGTWGKVRNGPLALLLGVAVGVVALYFGWAVWLMALVEDGPWHAFLDPAVMWALIQEINEQGAWGIGSSGTKVTGILLWILWFIEAVIVVGIAAFTPWVNLTETPFCESCDTWTDEEEDVALLEPTEEGLLKQALEQNQFEVLTLLPKAERGSKDCLHVSLHTCKSCNDCSYITIKHVAVTLDKDGKEQTETNNLLSNLSLPAEVVQEVRDIMTNNPVADVSEGEPEEGEPVLEDA